MRGLLVLLSAGLLNVACGENPISTLPPASAISPSPRSTVVLSGTGTKTVTARLGVGNYLVSWVVTDRGFNAFCSAPGDPDYGITISVGYANPTSLVPSKPTDSELVEGLAGGNYECQVNATGGSAWKIAIKPA